MAELRWVKSGRCNNGELCVEVARVDGGRVLRDGKNPDGPVLTFTDAEWDAFVGGVRDGDFDV